MPEGSIRLVVFSDDWGRHPSSCQHLVRRLLTRYPTLWVNTIGMRRPRLAWSDLRRIAGKIRQMAAPASQERRPGNLTVIAPAMWPGFRAPWQRRLNARRLVRAIQQSLGPRQAGETRVAITTLPITADLLGKLDVDRWVYYCVDDFSVWPGLDGQGLETMERQQVAEADALVVVSETLRQRLAGMGRSSRLLTHGIDLAHWAVDALPAGSTVRPPAKALPAWWPQGGGPIYLFWGLLDARLDESWCEALAATAGTLVLVGPQQSPPRRLAGLPRVLMPGPLPYEELPVAAAAADVLVMPYADLPVTRAMQPLKFKEYLATGKPVVARRLPATEPWAEAADLAQSAAEFVQVARQRAQTGLPDAQRHARQRLAEESWAHKAEEFEKIIRG